MKSKLTIFLVVSMMLLAALAPSVFADEDQTIVENVIGDVRFDTLTAAVVAAGLDDELSGGEWTVFAPTDTAFARIGVNAQNVADLFTPAELADLLLYHTLEGEVGSDVLLTRLGNNTMANGHIAGIKYFDGDIFVNDDSKVIDPDILASNGKIHVVDNVIIGPWPRTGEVMIDTEADVDMDADTTSDDAASSDDADDATESLADDDDDDIPVVIAVPGSIAGIAATDGRFDTLAAAIDAAGLTSALSTGEWTVFAPTDAAFAKLGLNADNVGDTFTAGELVDLLLYHALDEEVGSDRLLTRLGNTTMANGQIAGIKYFDGDIFINDDSRVTIADILATNGKIHAVDTVIMGPWPR